MFYTIERWSVHNSQDTKRDTCYCYCGCSAINFFKNTQSKVHQPDIIWVHVDHKQVLLQIIKFHYCKTHFYHSNMTREYSTALCKCFLSTVRLPNEQVAFYFLLIYNASSSRCNHATILPCCILLSSTYSCKLYLYLYPQATNFFTTKANKYLLIYTYHLMLHNSAQDSGLENAWSSATCDMQSKSKCFCR